MNIVKETSSENNFFYKEGKNKDAKKTVGNDYDCSNTAYLVILFLQFRISICARYNAILNNVTTASNFNQDFKDNVDLKMYYYVIDSQYSEGLPIEEVFSKGNCTS